MRNKLLILFCLLFFMVPAQAQASPNKVVSSTVNKVLSEMQANRKGLERDPARLYELVEEKVLPIMDVERISRLVVGKHWRRATDEQKKLFVHEFKTFLMRSYASGLFEYSGQEISYKPARYNNDKTKAIIDAFLHSETRKVPVSFKLVEGKDHHWRIYNVVIDSIDFVTNFRISYSSIIQERGMDGLINSLVKKNRS